MVGRRRLARLLVLDFHPPLRDQAPRCGQGHQRRGDPPRVSRLLPGLRSGRPLPLFPVDPHVRPGLRQCAIRVELSARGAALPDCARGRRPPAVRSDAQRTGRRRRRGEAEARGRCAGDGGSTRRHRAARRGVSGRRRPLRPDRRCRRQQGRYGRCCRLRARTGAAGTRSRRAGSRCSISPRCVPRRWSRRPTALRWAPTTRRLSFARASACARFPQTADPSRAARSGTRRRRAVAQERLDRPRPHPRCRSSRGRNGGRCCAKCGGCSATSSGLPTCPAWTGRRSTAAMNRCWNA